MCACLQAREDAAAWLGYSAQDMATIAFMTRAATMLPYLYKVVLPGTCALPDPSLLPNLRQLSVGHMCPQLRKYLPTLTHLHITNLTTLGFYKYSEQDRSHTLTQFSTPDWLCSDRLKDLVYIAPSLKHLSAGSMELGTAWVGVHPSWSLKTLRVDDWLMTSDTLELLPYNVATDDQGRPLEIHGPTSEKCVTIYARHLEVSACTR